MARIISIVNQKGGTGKSACTANLAVGLAQKNMKVLIVDADPQGMRLPMQRMELREQMPIRFWKIP